ncbi:MAG: hypothetical protein ACRD2E_11255, partial [Terriglobales bacterium]
AAQAPAGAAPRPAPPPVYNSPSNLKASEVVHQAIAALGGPAYLHFTGRRGQGHLFTFDLRGQLADPGILFWSYYRYPDAQRLELTKQRNVIYIYNGDRGWNVNYRGARPLGAKAMRRVHDERQHSLDVILRQWAAQPQTLMLYHAADLASARPVEQVSFYTAGGRSATVSFSISTHLPLEISWRVPNPYSGGFTTESVTFGNYQPFQGIDTPLTVESFSGTTPRQEEYYTAIQYGPLPATLFEPPPRRR